MLFNHALELLCGFEDFARCIQVHNYSFVLGGGGYILTVSEIFDKLP